MRRVPTCLIALATVAMAVCAAGGGPALAADRAAGGSAAATPLYAFSSRLVLSAGGARRAGAPVTLATNTGAAGQSWVLRGDGTIRPSYDERLCLSVKGARYRPRSVIAVAACTGARNERFATKSPSAHATVFAISPVAARQLCVAGGSNLENNTPVVLRNCAVTAEQEWSRGRLHGVAHIRPADHDHQADALAVLGSGAAGSAVGVALNSYHLGQFWMAQPQAGPDGPDQFVVLHVSSDTSLCLTASKAEASGVPLVVRTCDGSAAQEFGSVLYHKYELNSGWYLTTSDQRFCVSISPAGAAVLAACQSADPDQWLTTLALATAGAPSFSEFFVGNTDPGLALTVTAGKPGATLIVKQDQLLAGQFWAATPSAPGDPGYPYTTTLRSFGAAGMCLTAPGASPAAGTLLAVSRCDGSASQEFLRAASGALGAGDYSLDELVPLPAGSLCVAASGLHGGSTAELAPCAGSLAQSWYDTTFWAGWGLPPQYVNAYPVHGGALPSPGPLLGLAGATASGASAVLAPTAEGSAGQLWLPRSDDAGTVFGSVLNASWCLDAPALTAGTQLVAAACDGQADQEFVAIGLSDPQYVEYQSADDTSMCIAAGSTGGGATPAVLESCSPSDTAEQWWTYAAG